MKKLLAPSVLLTAIAGCFSSMAVAETWSPNGPVTLSSVGVMAVAKSVTLFCNLSGGGTLNGSDASVTNLNFTGGLCPVVVFTDLPYNLEPSGLNSVTFQNVRMFFFGNEECVGDLTGTFDQTTGQITFINAVLPSSLPLPGAPCVFNGIVETTPQASYTIP